MASTPLLPLYNQRGSPIPGRRSAFRLREKYLIALGGILVVCIVYSGFVFLPDSGRPSIPRDRQGIQHRVREVFRQPAQLVIPPPAANGPLRHHGEHVGMDPHLAHDAARLKQKIDEAQPQIPPPNPKFREMMEEKLKKDREMQKQYQKPTAQQLPVDAVATAQQAAGNQNVQQSEDPENDSRLQKIKEMMTFAWDGYAKYAWGDNELRPISKTGHSASIFGQSKIGATIIDALDTLYVMGLQERFDHAKKFVEMSFDLNNIRGDLSVFETNIRFLGGLLSAYALTKDDLFKQKAQQVADMLLPAFNTPTGIPLALINTRTKNGKNWGWASGGASILSEFGSLHLEFEYLTDITGNPIYKQKVDRIREVLQSVEKPNGLYPNYLNPKTGKWGSRHTSVGALGDSFYEYLLKSYVVTGHRDVQAKQMYDDAVKAIEAQLVQKSKNGLVYIAESKGSRIDHKMDHLACFVAGMFALQAQHEQNETEKEHYMQLAKDIGDTCHESYIRSPTGLGPESFRFTNEFEAKAINDRDKYYILRPEVIEGWFYLWRFTKEQKYRDWAWAAAMAIEKHCRSEAGYSGIRNVYVTPASKDDVQQSFFLAETLKYLYLIFADDNVLPLDQWVFNTEAHPLPVRLTAPNSPNQNNAPSKESFGQQ